MKTKLFLFFLLCCLCFSVGCSKGQDEKKPVVARVNDFNLTLEEFQVRLGEELELRDDAKATPEARLDFLQECITRELLIQEAKRRKLDRRTDFVRAIERYWESTLIRDLLAMKNSEIDKSTKVSREEVASRYQELFKESERESMPSLSDELAYVIEQELGEQKKTRVLQEWIAALQHAAVIEIDQDVLVQ
ncbi:MAG: hypothetical protein KAK02_03350 [Desulfobulbaceae bacterium]|nr:hypothetical protein [Desulfobulbaceae bacterium]